MPGSRENPIPTVGVVVFDPEACAVLLVYHEDAAPYAPAESYSLPLGRFDPHETPAGAAARALAEQTGVDVLPGALKPTGYGYTAHIEIKGAHMWYSLRTFLLLTERNVAILEPAAGCAPEWVPRDAVASLPGAPDLEVIVHDAVAEC